MKSLFANLPPLAERLRPKDWNEFFGQDELIGPKKPLRKLVEEGKLMSVIFWGPPGVGKTTLARLIAGKIKADFQIFSATTSGINEVREAIKEAQKRGEIGQKTILFIDEIHRFNKAQQDAFLSYVEDGTIILIGATTENPSFSIISPLLSRSQVYVLKPLLPQALEKILERAISDKEKGLGKFNIEIEPRAKAQIIAFADSDARQLLNALEFAVSVIKPDKDGKIKITGDNIKEILSKHALRYDKKGEEHYNLISAYIKSLRDSDPDGALYWLARMIESGEDPRFIARRMVIFSSEDIGNANPWGVVVANAIFEAVEKIGLPEAQINLAHGTTFLATCPKSNASYMALMEAVKDAKKGSFGVPLHLRNPVTKLMKEWGYGEGYKYAHEFLEAKIEQTHFPKEIGKKKYYRPKKIGYEKNL